MGILDSGPLGPFRKKLGPAIGRQHMGQNLLIPLYRKTKKPSSESQLLQRKKFAILGSFISSLKSLINPGFKAYAKKQSASNAAFSYNFGSAFLTDGEEPVLNYSKILCSRGQITTPNGLEISSTDQAVNFSWASEPQSRYCQFTDIASFVIYNPALEKFLIQNNVAKRQDLTFDMQVPANFSGHEVHCWMVFASADGKTRGDSKYAGMVTC